MGDVTLKVPSTKLESVGVGGQLIQDDRLRIELSIENCRLLQSLVPRTTFDVLLLVVLGCGVTIELLLVSFGDHAKSSHDASLPRKQKGLSKGTGLCHILQAYPAAVFAMDVDIKLMPNLMSMFAKEFGLNGLYALLMGTPPIVDCERHSGSSCGEGSFATSTSKERQSYERSNKQKGSADIRVGQGKNKKLKK